MMIDISDKYRAGSVQYDSYEHKSDILMETLDIENDRKYNYMIVPISIFNILEKNSNFIIDSAMSIELVKQEIPNLYKAGRIGEYEIFIDVYCQEDTIILSYDKAISRDLKLDSILNGEKHEHTKKIDVILHTPPLSNYKFSTRWI